MCRSLLVRVCRLISLVLLLGVKQSDTNTPSSKSKARRRPTGGFVLPGLGNSAVDADSETEEESQEVEIVVEDEDPSSASDDNAEGGARTGESIQSIDF